VQRSKSKNKIPGGIDRKLPMLARVHRLSSADWDSSIARALVPPSIRCVLREIDFASEMLLSQQLFRSHVVIGVPKNNSPAVPSARSRSRWWLFSERLIGCSYRGVKR
jgi:hypothetical protein